MKLNMKLARQILWALTIVYLLVASVLWVGAGEAPPRFLGPVFFLLLALELWEQGPPGA